MQPALLSHSFRPTEVVLSIERNFLLRLWGYLRFSVHSRLPPFFLAEELRVSPLGPGKGLFFSCPHRG